MSRTSGDPGARAGALQLALRLSISSSGRREAKARLFVSGKARES
jgi:hypothetical protein